MVVFILQNLITGGVVMKNSRSDFYSKNICNSLNDCIWYIDNRHKFDKKDFDVQKMDSLVYDKLKSIIEIDDFSKSPNNIFKLACIASDSKQKELINSLKESIERFQISPYYVFHFYFNINEDNIFMMEFKKYCENKIISSFNSKESIFEFIKNSSFEFDEVLLKAIFDAYLKIFDPKKIDERDPVIFSFFVTSDNKEMDLNLAMVFDENELYKNQIFQYDFFYKWIGLKYENIGYKFCEFVLRKKEKNCNFEYLDLLENFYYCYDSIINKMVSNSILLEFTLAKNMFIKNDNNHIPYESKRIILSYLNSSHKKALEFFMNSK